MSELCQLYSISRKTGYKWVDRYLRLGPAGQRAPSRLGVTVAPVTSHPAARTP